MSRSLAIILRLLSVLSIPVYWCGGPTIFGSLAAWRGGLTKDGKPHTGAARAFAILGMVVAILVLSLGNLINKSYSA